MGMASLYHELSAKHFQLAQLVEHCTAVREVKGSSPRPVVREVIAAATVDW